MRTVHAAIAMAATLLCSMVEAHGSGPWRADEGNTRGWQLMTPEERIAHQARVRGFSDYAACQAYRTEHHNLIVKRATERGLTPPDSHWDFCDRLKRSRDGN